MYPRNAASPEPIAIGAVVQITDGAVQSAGVTVRVKAVGQSEADGGGTTAYSTDGVVLYTPTQAETNYTSFVLVAKKTGCIPASVTVVTSESAVSGRVYVGTNGDKTGYSLTAGTGLGNQTANITGNLSGSVGSVTGAVGSVTGNVGGNVVGSVGSISGVTFPTHFNDLEIAANGHVSAAVYSIANNSITASSIQGGAITAAKFATDAITAAALAADAVSEIQSGLATAANQTTIIDRVTYGLTALVGACSDAQTAAETYTLSIGGSTFTVDYSGLDSSGNRSTTTLSKV